MVGAIVEDAVGADVGEAEGDGAIAAAQAVTAVAESAVRSCLRRTTQACALRRRCASAFVAG
jgi:hypothetical protein